MINRGRRILVLKQGLLVCCSLCTSSRMDFVDGFELWCVVLCRGEALVQILQTFDLGVDYNLVVFRVEDEEFSCCIRVLCFLHTDDDLHRCGFFCGFFVGRSYNSLQSFNQLFGFITWHKSPFVR